MNPLFYWMGERERMRQARAAGQPRPWTTDPVLDAFYFTNVMREYDKMSVWVQHHITDWQVHDKGLPVALGLARHLNIPGPITYLMDLDMWPTEGTRQELRRAAIALEQYRASGNQVFGGAYIISAAGMRHDSGWTSKIDYVVNGVVAGMVDVDLPMDSLESFTGALQGVHGWGAFMAYEVTCDLRWAPGWLNTAPDIYTWANPGPGARKGLRLLQGTDKEPNSKQALWMMRELLADAQRHPWPVEWPRPLEMRDIEHSLCEFGKYAQISAGGSAKRRYRG